MLQITKIFVLCLGVWQVSAMQGGRNTLVGEFPSFVGIVLPINNQICGATILNQNHVLTVANCMLTNTLLLIAPAQLSIMFGTNTVNFNNPRIQVQAIYVHQQYNPFTYANDIAVIRTQTNFNFPLIPIPLVATVPMSSRILFDTQSCNVVAWNTGTSFQQALAVPVVNRDQCNALPTYFGRITESMVCAGILTTGTGVCQINRGGALMCGNRLDGLLSSGFSCGTVANTPGVYTQIRHYATWIEDQMRRQDIPPANVSPIERLP